jgi:hypothetical protein
LVSTIHGQKEWEFGGAYRSAFVPFSQSPYDRCAPASLLSNHDGLFRPIISHEEPPVEVSMYESQSPPLVDKEWLTAEETSSGGPRDRDARSDLRIGIWPMKPSIRSPRPSGLKDDHIVSDRPGRRIFRTLTRFFIAVLIGIGATLGWQSHGDAAREMVVAQAPSLGWLLSVSTTKSPAVAATAPDPVQQLEPLASNLDVVRRSVEQLAAKQEQMAQNIAALLERFPVDAGHRP